MQRTLETIEQNYEQFVIYENEYESPCYIGCNLQKTKIFSKPKCSSNLVKFL